MATAQELLDATDLAILEVLQNGQHNRSGGLFYTKADLPELRRMRLELKAEVSNATKTKNRTWYAVPRRLT